MKKFMLILFINVIILELFLRLVGFALHFYQLSNQYIFKTDSDVTILTLGESTTADSFIVKSWPRLLEDALKKNDIKANIVNLAEPGTSSVFIYKNVISNLDRYKPHIVISMMGINDSSTNIYLKAGLLQNTRFFENLRIVKLTKFILNIHKFSFAKEQFKEKTHYFEVSDEIRTLIENKKYDAAQIQIHNFLNDKSEIQKIDYYKKTARVLNQVLPLRRDTLTKDTFVKLELMKESVKLSYNDNDLAQNILFWAKSQKRIDICQDIIYSLYTQAKSRPSDAVLNRMIECLPKDDLILQKTLSKFSPELEIKNEYSVQTKEVYQKLFNLFKKNNICWVIVQYPLLDVQQRMNYFSDDEKKYSKLKFVSNQENFKKALEAFPAADIFLDYFGGVFGHTTEKGNRLIAEQVIKPVQELIKNEDCPGF